MSDDELVIGRAFTIAVGNGSFLIGILCVVIFVVVTQEMVGW